MSEDKIIQLNVRLFNNLIEALIENAPISNCTPEFKKGKVYAFRLIRDHINSLEGNSNE